MATTPAHPSGRRRRRAPRRCGRAARGLFDDVAVGCTALASGDQIVLYTDGVTEARRADGEVFGEDRLEGAAAGADVPAQALAERIRDEVAAFTDTGTLDDVAVVVVGRR